MCWWHQIENQMFPEFKHLISFLWFIVNTLWACEICKWLPFCRCLHFIHRSDFLGNWVCFYCTKVCLVTAKSTERSLLIRRGHAIIMVQNWGQTGLFLSNYKCFFNFRNSCKYCHECQSESLPVSLFIWEWFLRLIMFWLAFITFSVRTTHTLTKITEVHLCSWFEQRFTQNCAWSAGSMHTVPFTLCSVLNVEFSLRAFFASSLYCSVAAFWCSTFTFRWGTGNFILPL